MDSIILFVFFIYEMKIWKKNLIRLIRFFRNSYIETGKDLIRLIRFIRNWTSSILSLFLCYLIRFIRFMCFVFK
jgi:hypothetical protein